MRLLLLLVMVAQVCLGQEVKHRFMPDNDLNRYDNINELSNISERDFFRLLKEVEDLYRPIVKKHGGELVFVNDWEDPTVNAYAQRIGRNFQIHMFGGLARRNEVTQDAFQLVACHEMGHHLGGFPYVQGWAANDGQSDYFAVHACGKLLWGDQVEKNAERAKVVMEYPRKVCDQAYASIEDRHLCYRLTQAAKSLADLLSYGRARFETPDLNQVSRTISQHPPGQCRLDTMVAAGLCQVPWDEEVIPRDEKMSEQYLCVQKRELVGFRPRCWFKPSR